MILELYDDLFFYIHCVFQEIGMQRTIDTWRELDVCITWRLMQVQLHVLALLLCEIYIIGLVILPCKF